MASYITYKTIISKAITDFNAIQDALATIGANYNSAGIAATGATGSVLVPTGDVASVMTSQLQLKAAGTLSSPTVSSDGTVDVKISDYSSYRYIKLNLGKAITPATTITPSDLTGAFANGKYTVSLASKTQAITPTVTAGWITSGTAGNVTVAAKTFDIAQLTAYKWSTNKLYANGSGYVVKDQLLATMDNATITAGAAKTINVSNSLKLNEADSTTVGGVNIFSKLLDISADTSTTPNPSGYTNVSTTEPTSGNYISFTAKSSGGSATTTTTVSKAGYTTTGTYDIGVSTTGHTDVTYYYPVKSAAATVSGSKAATTPTIAAASTAVSGKSRITNATLTTDGTKISQYYLAMTATAPATTGIGLSANVTSTGYLGANSQISGSASTTAKSSGSYYYAIPKATFSVSGNTIKAATAGYIGTGDSVANVSAGSLKYSVGFTATYNDVDNKQEWGDIDPSTLFKTSLTDDEKAKDYYTLVATGHGSLTAGYISSNPSAASTTYYMPKATLAYVEDSNKNKIIEVKTAGFLPAGVLHDIGEISGTLDMASLSISLGNTPTYDSTNNLYKLSASLVVGSAGYVESGTSVSATASLAKATFSGGGLSGATTSALSISAGSDYTSTTGAKTITVKASSHTITRAATTVKSNGYITTNDSILGSGTATVTGGSTTIHIKDGTLGSNSSSCSITQNTTTAAVNKGNAKVFATAAAADASGNYVLVKATSSSSCAVTSAGWLDAQTKTASGSATAYIKASVNPTVNYSSTASTANLGATQFTDNSTAKSVSITGGTNKTVSSTAAASFATTVKDTYIVGDPNLAKGTQGTATISAECSGSNVDSAFQSLYNRMLGYAYTDVSPDA